MSTLHYLQLACEAAPCERRFPDIPMAHTPTDGRQTASVTSVGMLRAQAAERGWETKRHTKGRDLCPPCRVAEIQRLYGWAFEEKASES